MVEDGLVEHRRLVFKVFRNEQQLRKVDWTFRFAQTKLLLNVFDDDRELR